MIEQFPDFILHRIGVPPTSKYVVSGSTPVPFFGNFLNASVYTIGINPSHQEFLSSNEELLTLEEKRLSDFQTLNIDSINRMNSVDANHSYDVLKSCLNYFQKKPYKWFNFLDEFVNRPLQASYFNNTACHLDLVQWATNPIWNEIIKDDRVHADYLLKSDLPFLIEQVHWLREENDNLRYIFLSGRTVVECLSDLFALENVGKTEAPDKDRQYSLFRGRFGAIQVYGTTMNVPDSHTSGQHRKLLAEWLRCCKGESVSGNT